MATIPHPAAELLDEALVAELTVVDPTGRPVTYPLIPLWDGERIYMTSSTLFSRKLEHIGAKRARSRCRSPIRSASGAGRIGSRSRATRASSRTTRTAAGSACCRSGRPRSRRSSRSSRRASRCRLFFERALIEIIPRRVLYWA